MRDRTGYLVVLSEIQQGILAESIQPNPTSRVAIADTHRDQPDMRCAAMAGVQRGGNDLSGNADGNRAERILLAVFAYEDNL